MQFTLSLQFFSASKCSVFWRVLAGRLRKPCLFSFEECYLLAILGANCLLFEDGIVEASIPGSI